MQKPRWLTKITLKFSIFKAPKLGALIFYMKSYNSFSPIGIFDSGLGGLSILKEISERLPGEDIYYFADSNNAPYGEKTKDEIIKLSIKNTEYLMSKGCKLIVVACNTATTNAISVLRSKFDIPFIGIEPAIKPAALHSKTKQIGVLATKGTLTSELFHESTMKFSQIKMLEIEGKGIVEAIESNSTHTKEFQKQLKNQLKPLLDANIDYLVLGCSHYPFITDHLKNIFSPQLKIIDSGFAVAKQTERILTKFELANKSGRIAKIEIFTNNTCLEALNTILNKLELKNCSVI